MRTSKFNHDLLAQAIRSYSELDEVETNSKLLSSLSWQIERWSKGIYLLVVVGEVNKGKSSFINALLGETALTPVADKTTTSVPYKIIYGEQVKHRIHFLPEDPTKSETTPDPVVVDVVDIAQYGTETGLDGDVIADGKGNADNKHKVEYISIEHPHLLLKEGLVIIDLPGLGGLFEKHSHLVWEYLDPERVDHVAFVVDSTENPFAQAESDTIKRLKQRGIDRFFFLQTKTDVADSSKVELWKDRNLGLISDLLEKDKKDISYFLVSNEYKQQANKTGDQDYLEESGFPEIEGFINDDLMINKKDVLAVPLGVELSTRIINMENNAMEKLSIYLADSKEKKEELEQLIKDNYEAHKEWSRVTLPEIERNLARDLNNAAIKARDMLDLSLNPSKIVEPVMEQIIDSFSTEQHIIENTEKAESICIDTCLSRLHEASFEFRQLAEEAFLDAQEKIGKSIPKPAEVTLEDSVSEVVTGKVERTGSWLKTFRSSFYGNTLGAAAGYGGAMLLAAVFPPAGVVAGVAAFVGGLFGANKGVKDTRKQDFDVACSRLKNILTNASIQAAQELKQNMRNYADATTHNMMEHIQNANRQRLAELEDNVAELGRAKERSEKDFIIRRKEISDSLKKIRTVKDLLRRAGFARK